MDACVEETRVRFCDGLGGRVVHEDDFAWFTLRKAREGVEQGVDARCWRTGIVDGVGTPFWDEATRAICEEEHLAGVGDGSDAKGVKNVAELLDELRAYATKTDDGEVKGTLAIDCVHRGGICACRKVGDPMAQWKYCRLGGQAVILIRSQRSDGGGGTDRTNFPPME